MTDGGKPKTGRAGKRKRAAKAAEKPSPADSAAAAGPAAAPEATAEEPAAPVGFTARDTAGDASAEPQAAAKKGGGAGVAVLLIAAVAVVAVAGYLTRAAWLPKFADRKPAVVAGDAAETAKPSESAEPSPPAAAPAADSAALDALAKEREQLRAELDRLMARLDGVEKSMDTAKKMIRATAPPEEKIVGAPSLQQLSDRIGALEKQEASLKDLRQRVERMEKDAAGDDGGNRAIVLAVAGLGDAVARGEPFARHLEALKAVAGDDPDIKAAAALLAKGAATGIPTFGDLRDRFAALAGRIVAASKARDDGGWMARVSDRIASLVTWRRVGEGAEGESVDAVVARAEARLKAGDLAGAVKALDGLAANKKAAAAAGPWLADAKARVTAERTVASLHVHAVSLLAPDKP